MDHIDQILHALCYMRELKYGEVEIVLCLYITKEQLKEFDALLQQSKQVPKVYFLTLRVNFIF